MNQPNPGHRSYVDPRPSIETNGRMEDKVPALKTWNGGTYKEDDPWYIQLEKAHYPIMCMLITLANVIFVGLSIWNSSGYDAYKHAAPIGIFIASLMAIAFTNHHTRKDREDVRHDY